jgi:hypothetical protein
MQEGFCNGGDLNLIREFGRKIPFLLRLSAALGARLLLHLVGRLQALHHPIKTRRVLWVEQSTHGRSTFAPLLLHLALHLNI